MRERIAGVLGGALGVVAIAGTLLATFQASAADRHVGYYYPPPQTVETYALTPTPSARARSTTGRLRSSCSAIEQFTFF